MNGLVTSAYGTESMAVQDVLNDPKWLQDTVIKNLDGAFVEEYIFRNAGPNDGAVAYRELASNYLNDDAEEVAEFAEIPVSGVELGDVKTLVGAKVATGIRISYEMVRENKIDQLSLRTTAAQNTMVRNSVLSTLEAFRKANVPTLAVTKSWEENDAKPVRDIRSAKNRISLAAPENSKKGDTFGYEPDTLLIGNAGLELLLMNADYQQFFRGDLASENPLYRGVKPMEVGGLRVVTSALLDDNECYVLQSGVAGFVSDTYPLTVSELYSEHGNASHGGANMSWRMDLFRKRIIGLDNPKAVVKLTGLAG